MKREVSTKGKKILYSIISISLVVITFLIWDGCNSRKGLKDFENQISHFQLKEQGFKKIIDKQGKEITEQKQTILTRNQAIQQGLIENTKLRRIKSQVSITSKTGIDTLFIPFKEDDNWDDWDDCDSLRRNFVNTIKVPKSFSDGSRWYWVGGKIIKGGIKIDSISFFNIQTITIGDKKEKGLKNIFKRRIPTVEIKNESPHINILGLQNVIIKKEPKKWYQTTVAKVLTGFALGTYTTIKIGKSIN